MPRGSPFTALCTQLAHLGGSRTHADLHLHSTASDGDYTPSQVVALAREAGLRAIALTDHDTCAGVREAQASDGPAPALEVIAGVEVSAEFAGREVHLLGYFISLDYDPLHERLARVCASRRERFWEFVRQLQKGGLNLPNDRARLMEQRSASLGRRHVAALLVAAGAAQNLTEAFHRFLSPLHRRVAPKELVAVDEAIHLLHAAGGVVSLAHPHPELTEEHYRKLASLGLDALEVEYPWGRRSPAAKLREIAERLGFAATGGSDCHGPHPAHRRIGSHGIGLDELERLRGWTGAHQGAGTTGS
jgi:predicted metal-dependent phosphoesterase TrpH